MPYIQTRVRESDRRMLVTIGPQCAGKTTYLSSFGSVTDVTIDDMIGTYEKISVDDIINYQERGLLTASLCRKVCNKALFEFVDKTASVEQLPILLYFTEVCDVLPSLALM
jgi:ABC-type uncharacterized transport system ATPase subunit